MSELKATPGPWYADAKGYIWRRPLKDLYEYGGGVAGDKPLATVCKGWWGEDTTGYPVEANAHLIAAAPDLYRALEQILDEPNNSMSDRKCLVEIVRIARAALAKIKEET